MSREPPRIVAAVLVVVCASTIVAAEEDSEAASSRFEIDGEAGGGTVSLGLVGRPDTLLAVPSTAGETAGQIVTKLVNKHQQDPESSPFQWVVAATEGTAVLIENTTGGDVFLRSTDSGIETLGAVSNVKATASKADGKVALSWDLPTPTPDRIIVWRSYRGLTGVSGTTTSCDDTAFDEEKAGEPFRIAYTIICAKKDSEGTIVKCSDIAGVLSDNPELMPDDVFRITTEQKYVKDAVTGQQYTSTLYKNAGTNPVSWSVGVGTLPDGLTLGTEGLEGVISGTPTATGTWEFTVTLTDANGTTASKTYSITVTGYPLLE